jgi:cytochrome c5
MTRLLLIGAALLVTAAAAAAGDTVTITLPPDLGALPPGSGMTVTQRSCQMCHSLDYITIQPPGGEAQWRGVVTKMIKVYGAPIPDEDASAIVQYLSGHFGAGR